MQEPNDLEQLLCAVMYLLTRQAGRPDQSLAAPIRDHLQWLTEHPCINRQPQLRSTCRRLMRHWHRLESDARSDAGAGSCAPDPLH